MSFFYVSIFKTLSLIFMKNKFYLLLIVFSLGVAFYFYSKYRIAPKIEFKELNLQNLEGEKVSLQDYAGKNIFITMWAPWCKDCLVEMPDLQNLKEKLNNDNFIILAISDFDIEKEKSYAEKFDYDFEYLHLNKSFKDLSIFAIPTNYIINTKGKVVYEKVGAEKDWQSKETIEKIRLLID